MLGLGNDLLCDDGVGLTVARILAGQNHPGLTVIESGEAGLALLELLADYEEAVIVDSIQTGAAPGTIHVLGRESFAKIVAPSAHYAGLPEVFALGERIGVHLPHTITVIAIEVADPYSFAEELTPEVSAAVPRAVEQVLLHLNLDQVQFAAL